VTASERRQAIIRVLCKRKRETIENLAFEFDVTTRTILRDIVELSLSYPIYTLPGKYYGGVYIAEDYYLGKQYLSDEQLKLIISLQDKVDDDQRRILESIVRDFRKK
jgi:predicted DNA-binding transcriptional regulator YafY